MKFRLHLFVSMLWFSHAACAQSLNDDDLLALLSIKAGIDEDPLGILSSWNNSLHFCNWRGVSCGNMTRQRVVGLDLAGLELRGTLSASIGNLTFLKNLSLGNNFFSGSIPQEICQLYQLQQLILSNNSFEGPIPRNFTYLSHMNVIHLDRNGLWGTIPAEFGLLSDLVELHVSLNLLSGIIPSSLGNLSALRLLSLSDNYLVGNIPEELGKLSSLQLLQLSSNNLAGPLPPVFHNITSIQDIILASNNLSGSLPWDFGLHLPKLRTFYVGENQFEGPIPASITNASALVTFDIGANSFSGPIPMDLGNLKRLQRLDFSYNLLGGNEKMGLNFITSLTNCTNLRVIRLNSNNLSGGIPDGLENLKNLGSLALGRNSLTGTIPEFIGNLSSLQGLDLSNNVFLGEIPSNIGNLNRLSVLEMQQNKLGGDIPRSLGNCTTLLLLNLSHNRFEDAFPNQIFYLPSLTFLSLANNLLSGNLSPEVGNLSRLTGFDVSDNHLSGDLPSELGACVSLQQFSAQGNLFNGSIPPSLGQLRGVQFLDLSRNNLTGQIPADLASLPFLMFLNLSFNMLEGEVPTNGPFTNITAFSIEGNVKLCGGLKSLHLPECPKEMQQIGKLKFSMVIIIPALIVIIVMSVAYMCVFYYYWPRRERSLSIREPLNSPLGEHYPKLSYTELLQATDGFSPTNLIATGRYSWVYKGVLTGSEQRIAVKVIKLDQSGARKSFLAECEALRNIRHRNLVKIMTACSGTDLIGNEFKALVYGFMSNGNLDSWLHPIPTASKNLDMIQRLNIAIDVASALVHLHHNCEIPVIHRDIKPSNVLLDDELCAHVGDFGSARSLLVPIDKTTHVRIRSSAIGIVGTIGYIALECAVGGPVSTLVDVYSYGILLLEMFTGKRPTDSMFKDNFSLHNYVKKAVRGQVMSIADPRIIAEWEDKAVRIAGEARTQNACAFERCLASVFRVGVTCSAHVPGERMQIADALLMLQTIRDALSKII